MDESVEERLDRVMREALPPAYAISALVAAGDMVGALEVADGDALAVACVWANQMMLAGVFPVPEDDPHHFEDLAAFVAYNFRNLAQGAALAASSSCVTPMELRQAGLEDDQDPQEAQE